MIERLETYLIELMRQFNAHGIKDADGNEFQPDEFEPGENFNWGALKEFPFDVNAVRESLSFENLPTKPSRAPFFNSNYTAFNNNPELLARVKAQGWIDASGNDHEYPIAAVKALWNQALHSLVMIMSNPMSVIWYKDFHNQFMNYTAAYMDDTRVTLPEAVEKGVKYFCIPRIIDQRTLAFAEECLKFTSYVESLQDPFADLKNMYSYAPQQVHDEIDRKKPKTIIGFKVTLAALKDRIGRYKARTGEIPTAEKSAETLTKMTELKQPAVDALKKYEPYFTFPLHIATENDAFESNPDVTNETKAQFYTAQLEKFAQFEAQAAPTAAEIETTLQELKSLLPELSATITRTFGKEGPIYYFTPNYVEALYFQNRPEDEVIVNVELNVIDTVKNTIDKLERYKKTIERTQQNSKKIKHHIETKLQEVTILGKVKKLVADKVALGTKILKLQGDKERNETSLQNISQDGAQFLASETQQKMSGFRDLIDANTRLQDELRGHIEILEKSENWDKKIEDELLRKIARSLRWSDETLQKWQQKNNDYSWGMKPEEPQETDAKNTSSNEVGSEVDSKNKDSGSLFGNLSSYAANKLSSLKQTATATAYWVSASIVDITPKQELITLLRTNLEELEGQYYNNNNQFIDLNSTLTELQSHDGASLEKATAQIQRRKNSIEGTVTHIDEHIAAANAENDALSAQFRSIIVENTTKLTTVINTSTQQLSALAIQPGTIAVLKDIFETTENDIKKIRAEFDSIIETNQKVFDSEEINAEIENFNRQYELYQQNQLKLLTSMKDMAAQLLTDYSTAGVSTEKKSLEQHVVVLATQLKDLALTYLPTDKTLEEKIQAKEKFETTCENELYSNHIRTAAGVIVGIITTIVLSAAVATALAVFFAGGGWLAFIIGVPLLAKVGATSAATTLAIGGSLIGASVGEKCDEKLSMSCFNQWRFFYEHVDTVANETCIESPRINLPRKNAADNSTDNIDIEISTLDVEAFVAPK